MRLAPALARWLLAVAAIPAAAQDSTRPYSFAEWGRLQSILGQGVAAGNAQASRICGINPDIEELALQQDANEAASDSELRNALLRGLRREQILRLWMQADDSPRADANLRSVDADNRNLLARQFDRSGFPTLAQVGEQGVYAAFMMSVHADPDQALQRRSYALMQAAASSQTISPGLPAVFRALRANALEGKPYAQTYHLGSKAPPLADPKTLSPEACFQAIAGPARVAWLRQHLGEIVERNRSAAEVPLQQIR
jgi:hypothetical protein